MDKSPHSSASIALRELLKEKRLERGLHQSDISTILKRPQSFVSKYENGERKIDLIDFIFICKSMNIEPKLVLEEFIKIIENPIKNSSFYDK